MKTPEKLRDLFLRRWPFVAIAIIAALHILKVIHVDGYGFGLMGIAFLPALLPLVAKYIESLKIGRDGLEANTRADNEGKAASQIDKPIIAANSLECTNERHKVFRYLIDARRVIATLWHYQKQSFGEDSLRRWGFGVGIGAPDYRQFQSGSEELARDGLVHIDSRGLAYLTNEGVGFCKEHNHILEADGPHYTKFVPAVDKG